MMLKPRINKHTLGWSLLATMASSASFSQALPERSNILLIITDQQSSESLSFNLGNKYLNTPNMDYLAKHGISFTNAYCANPLSIPSRTSMFTGRYPHETGIQFNDNNKLLDPEKYPSLGVVFKKAGYETGYVGKWHLPYDVKEPGTHGFIWTKNIKNNGVDTLLPDAAISFMEIKRDKPFFLVVSFVNPHNICQWARGENLPDGSIGDPPSPDKCPPLRPNSMPSENETDIMQLLRKSFQASPMFPVSGFSDDKWRQYIWAYYRMIEKVDAGIGKILTAMRASGLDKNTVVIFLSDHGDCQGAHRWNQKTMFFEEAAKVPFIISWNGFKPGRSDYLVQTGIDLMPTLCDLAGIESPGDLPGVSLKEILIKGSKSDKRDYVVVSSNPVQGEAVNGYKPEPEGRMLVTRQFKYWIFSEGKQRETLYNLKNDPGEMVNLSGKPEYRNELEKCRNELIRWAEKHNDPFLKYLKNGQI